MHKSRVSLLLGLFILSAFSYSYAQIVGSTTSCLNSTTYYNLPSFQPITWTVSGSQASVHLADNRFQVLWKQAGSFSVTVTYLNSSNQISTATTTVTVNSLPSPAIQPQNSNLCVSIIPDQMRIVGGREQRQNNLSTCYSVCDSGWYYFNVSGSTGSTFSWSSSGNASIVPLNASGDSVRVKWTTVGYTDLVVQETNTLGCIGEESICIQVMQSPTSCFSSAPAADNSGTIHTCLNAPLSLNSGCSQPPYGSNIVFRKWIFGDGNVVSNPNYVEHSYSQAGQYTLMLIVESNCSCADTFVRTVIVDATAGPDIFCINSVCHDSISTFSTSSSCASLQWSVTGGSFVAGTSTTNDSVSIAWGNGNSGYGTVSLLSSCSGACPFPTTVFVPILPSNATITGRGVVCNNSVEIYSVPFVPTTQYVWMTCTHPSTPSSCTVISTTNSNAISIPWSASSTLPQEITTLKVMYSNPFLGCSGESELTITVAIATHFRAIH